ncbi:MAG: hypothetical protein ACI8SE_001685 [Bacteroidia bacterium]|jgi:hypothetical protein
MPHVSNLLIFRCSIPNVYGICSTTVYVLVRSGIDSESNIMKKSISTVLVLSKSIAVQADERLYRKLDRKFSKDPAKGLAFARKLKSNRSTEPDAYYFLSKMYLEKYLSEKRLVKQYSALNRAATEAYRSKKYATNHP